MNKTIIKLKENRTTLTVLVIIAGLILIALSYIAPSSDLPTDNTENELELYGQKLEEKLGKTLNYLTGTDCFEIMITFKSSYENVYSDLSDKNENKAVGTVDVFSSNRENREATVIKRKNPEIAGVVIAAKTFLDADSLKTVKEAVATALNISKSKIYIIGGVTANEKNH